MEAILNLIQTPGLVIFGQTKHEPSQVSVVNYILKNSMKRKFKDAETVINIHLAAERFMSLILPLQLKNPLQLEKLDWDSEILELCESISLMIQRSLQHRK
ncbi:unnamed protein product [Brassica oleracea var. botrytis]